MNPFRYRDDRKILPMAPAPMPGQAGRSGVIGTGRDYIW